MEKLKEKLQEALTSKEKRRSAVLIVLGVLAVLALLLSEFFPSSQKTTKKSAATLNEAGTITESTEKKLKTLLSSMDGVGDVTVMVTLESCYENVYATETKTKEQKSPSGVNSENSEAYVTVKDGSGAQCLIVKVYEPKIRGVAVIAEGAGNPEIKKAITDTVAAALGISTAKISVEKMTDTKEETK